MAKLYEPYLKSYRIYKTSQDEFTIATSTAAITATTITEESEKEDKLAKYTSPQFFRFALEMQMNDPIINEFSRTYKINITHDNNKDLLAINMAFLEMIIQYRLFNIGDAHISLVFCDYDGDGIFVRAIKYYTSLCGKDGLKYCKAYTRKEHPLEDDVWIDSEGIEEVKADSLDLYTSFEEPHDISRLARLLKVGGTGLMRLGRGVAGNEWLLMNFTGMFDEVYVAKPLMSERIKSEVYLVGKGYLGALKIDGAGVRVKGPKRIEDFINELRSTLDATREKYIDELIDAFNRKKGQDKKFMMMLGRLGRQMAMKYMEFIQPLYSCIREMNIRNDHHFQYYLEYGEAPPSYNQLDRILDLKNGKRESYQRRMFASKSIEHWGQLKLLLSEIEFLTLYWLQRPEMREKPVHMVYAGASPGSHIVILAELFPLLTFDLYDPRIKAFDARLVNMKQVKLYGFFDDDAAKKYADKSEEGYPLMFLVSDIRSGDDQTDSTMEFEDAVRRDMDWQARWCELSKCDQALLKFRLPYGNATTNATEKYEYLAGTIYIQAFSPITSTETRLVPNMPLKRVEWDAPKYQDQLYYHNTRIRPASFVGASPYPQLCDMYELDGCYDCVSMLKILSDYLKAAGSSEGPERLIKRIKESIIVQKQ
jgi:hypothetical protein